MYSIIIQGKSLNGSFTEKTLLIQQSIDCNHENTINTFFRCSIIKHYQTNTVMVKENLLCLIKDAILSHHYYS